MISTDKGSYLLSEDHFLVKASAGTNVFLISELFSSLREQANMYHPYAPEETFECVSAIKDHIQAYLAQLGREHIERINQELNYTFSANSLAGIQVMEALIDVPYMEHRTKRARFSNLLAAALQVANNEVTVDAAISGLHALVRDGGSLAIEIVSSEAMQCLEWMAVADTDHYLYTSCRIIGMLAAEVPEMLRPSISTEPLLQSIWISLCHPCQRTREYAGEALDRLVHAAIVPQQALSRSVTQCEMYLSKKCPIRFWHGSLLMLICIARNTRNPDYAMTVMDFVLQKRLHTDLCCRLTLIRMIPFFPLMTDLFVACYITRTLREVLYFYTSNGDPATKSCAFIALAELISNLKREAVLPHLNDMMKRTLDALCKVASEEEEANKQVDPISEKPGQIPISTSDSVSIASKANDISETSDSMDGNKEMSRIGSPSGVAPSCVFPLPENTKGTTESANSMPDSHITKRNVTIEALKCLGEIAKISDKAWLQPQIEAFMDRLFAGGLNRFLTDSLSILGESLPEFVPTFQERLLTIIMHTLQTPKENYVASTESSKLLPYRGKRRPRIRIYGRSSLTLKLTAQLSDISHFRDFGVSDKFDPYRDKTRHYEQDEGKVAGKPSLEDRILAVRTLATFNPKSNDMIQGLLRTHLAPLLKDPSVELREVVVRTILKIFSVSLDIGTDITSPLSSTTTMSPTSSQSCLMVDTDILREIVDIGVADIADGVRYEVMKGLDSRLDSHLASPDILETLFMSLHDEKLGVREAGLSVICRLTKVHPAYVIPALKKIQAQFIAELQHSRNYAYMEHSARMLLQMICNDIPVESHGSPQQDFLGLVLEKIQSGSGPSQLCTTLFELVSGIVQRSILHHDEKTTGNSKVLDVVVSSVQDRTSSIRRRAALNALAGILRSTSLVSEAFHKAFPDLFSVLLQCLHGETRVDTLTRREVLCVLGTVGAVDPMRLKRLHVRRREQRLTDDEASAVERFLVRTILPARCNRRIAEHYPAVLLSALVKILSSRSIVSASAMQTMSSLLTTLKPTQLVPHLELLLPIGLQLLSDANRRVFHADVLSHMLSLLHIDQQKADASDGCRHALVVLEALSTYCETCDTNSANTTSCRILVNVVKILSEIARSFSTVIRPGIESWIFNFMVQRMIEDRTEKREICMLVIQGFESFISALDKDIYYLVPLILQYIKPASHTPTGIALNMHCLNFLSVAAKQTNFKEISTRTVHHLLRLLEHTPSRTVEHKTTEVLCEILKALGKFGSKFLPLIQMYSEAKGVTDSNFQQLIQHFSGVQNIRTDKEAPATSPTSRSAEIPFTGAVTSSTGSSDQTILILRMTPRREVTQNEITSTLAKALGTPASDIELVHLQRTVPYLGHMYAHIRFIGSNALRLQNLLFQKTEENCLPASLHIESVKQKQTELVPEEGLSALMSFFSGSVPIDRSTSEWMQWFDSLSLEMLRHSTDSGMRCISSLANEYSPLIRDLFPYVFHNVFRSLREDIQSNIMHYLTRMVLVCEKEVCALLISLVEFLMPYRVPKPSVEFFYGKLETRRVQRGNLFDKFGIGYGEGTDPKPADTVYNDHVVVTRIAENSPGANAKVPVGSILIEIDGIPVQRVSEIHSLLDGRLEIMLTIQPPPRARYVHIMRPFFDLDVLIQVSLDANNYARALSFL